MKRVFLIVFLMCFAGSAWAAPFLICDPQAGVEEYTLMIDGVAHGTHIAQPDGSAQIDLAQFNLPDGEHSYVLIALNVWGASGPSDPFINIKIVLVLPSGLALSK